MPLLEGEQVTKYFGGLAAVSKVDFHVEQGEIVGLIGPNGAGKTTLLNTISGLLRPGSGSVEFLGKRIDGLAPHSIVELGISHVPEGRKLFTGMTVRENLEMGAYPYHAWQQKKETLEIADRAYVLENGHMVLEGACDKLLQSDYVRKAYLGI